MSPRGFICYPRTDFEAVRRLEVHLSPIGLRYGVDIWWDRNLLGGDSWHPEIQRKLGEADFFIAVITPDFFSSVYIQQTEWPAIEACRRRKNALVVPAILRPCMWEGFLNAQGQLQAIPTHPQTHRVEPALSSAWYNEEGLLRIALDIEQSLLATFSLRSTWTGPQTDAGLKFVAETDDETARYGELASTALGADLDAAGTDVVRQLHSSVLRLANRLARDINNLGNQPTWENFVEAVGSLPALVGDSPEVLAQNLGRGWAVLQSFAVAQAHDDAIAHGLDSDAGPLGSTRRVLLDELLAVFGSLLGCFPTITQTVIPALIATQGNPIPAEVVRQLVHRAISEGLLDAESGKFLGILMEASQGQSEAARRLASLLEPTSRNLGFFVVAIAAATSATPRESWSPLHTRSRDFTRKFKDEIAAVNQGGIAVEAALNAVVQQLDAKRLADQAPFAGLPSSDGSDIPEDVEVRARELLLRGSEVPVRWIPAIKKLAFAYDELRDLAPFRTLHALKHLRLTGCPVRSLEPLENLTGLVTLSVARAPLIDAKPLTKLANIQFLNLSETDIEDFSPIENLSNLQELRLSQTAFSDFSLLDGLKELKLLNLTQTKLRRVSGHLGLPKLRKLWLTGSLLENCQGLGALSGLRELWLDRTPLEAIDWDPPPTSLRKLILSNSAIMRLDGLSGCPELRRLDISGTRVLDLAPLQVLQKLEILIAYRTKLTDMSAITLSPKLAEIQVGNKQQAEKMLGMLLGLPAERRHWMRIAPSFRGSSIVPSTKPYVRATRSGEQSAGTLKQGTLFEIDEK